MKLKKSIKVILILFLLSGLIMGGYYFNHWFFSNFKTKSTLNKEVKNIQGKEIIEDKNDNISNKVEKTKTTEKYEKKEKSEKKKIRTTKVYYCEDDDTLVDEDKCETTIEKDAIKIERKINNTNSNKFVVEFDINAWANEYGVSVNDVKNILSDTCKEELDGTFEVNYGTGIGSCYFSDTEKEKSYTYDCLDSSYTLKGEKCIKSAKVSAKVKYGCPDGYKQDGIYCIEE